VPDVERERYVDRQMADRELGHPSGVDPIVDAWLGREQIYVPAELEPFVAVGRELLAAEPPVANSGEFRGRALLLGGLGLRFKSGEVAGGEFPWR
jgi:hypothetical protein